MAIGVRRIDSVIPCDLGQRGMDLVRLTGDGAATTVLITLGPESGIKTIRGAVCPSRISHNIPVAGVAASTGFTLTLTAATDLGNGLFMDVLVVGDGR
jgi:hypothetical protein